MYAANVVTSGWIRLTTPTSPSEVLTVQFWKWNEPVGHVSALLVVIFSMDEYVNVIRILSASRTTRFDAAKRFACRLLSCYMVFYYVAFYPRCRKQRFRHNSKGPHTLIHSHWSGVKWAADFLNNQRQSHLHHFTIPRGLVYT